MSSASRPTNVAALFSAVSLEILRKVESAALSAEFTGRLVDLGFGAPDCGHEQFDTLAVYDQIEGAGLPEKVYVVHRCIELPRTQVARSAGNLTKFVIGERHRVQVAPSAPARPGILTRGAIEPGSAPLFYATKTEQVVAKDHNPQTIGGLNLGAPEKFAPGLQEAARAVAQSVGQPQDFYAQIEPSRATNELIFHLWHKDAFLPANQHLAGNPGGKCRDVYYQREQKKVARTLYWQ